MNNIIRKEHEMEATPVIGRCLPDCPDCLDGPFALAWSCFFGTAIESDRDLENKSVNFEEDLPLNSVLSF